MEKRAGSRALATLSFFTVILSMSFVLAQPYTTVDEITETVIFIIAAILLLIILLLLFFLFKELWLKLST